MIEIKDKIYCGMSIKKGKTPELKIWIQFLDFLDSSMGINLSDYLRITESFTTKDWKENKCEILDAIVGENLILK